MYSEPAAPVDPYSDAYNAPAPPSSGAQMSLDPREAPVAARARSRSPVRDARGSPSYHAKSPPPKPKHAPETPRPSNVLGVFGLSIRTIERDLEAEFARFGRVEKVTIVYDQRSDRSRGFGFITMATVDEAARCIQELNGIDLNGRRIRVDYSVTERPHQPTPGEYMGHRRAAGRDRDFDRRGPYREPYRGRDSRRDPYEDRDRYDRDRYDRDRYDRGDRGDRYDYDRDGYGRDRDWRRRSPPRRYSPERRRRSYSRSPPRGGASPPRMREYDIAPPSSGAANGEPRW